MLTKVFLEGPLGHRFGREWEFDVNSPNEALRMVDANRPGVFTWIKANLKTYENYRVVVEYEDGRIEELCNEDYGLERRMATITFVPLVQGASSTVRIVVGIVLIVVGVYTGNQYVTMIGVSLVMGGVIEMLTPRPKLDSMDRKSNEDRTSYYFNGAANTTGQGVPVQLIYGRCLVGSHAISAAVTIDQLL